MRKLGECCMGIIIGESSYESLVVQRELQCWPRAWGGLKLIVVGPELDSALCDILVDPGRFFDFAITFPGCMEFYTLDSLLNCCLVLLACGGWFGHEVFLDVVSRHEVTDFSTTVSSPNVLDCRLMLLHSPWIIQHARRKSFTLS